MNKTPAQARGEAQLEEYRKRILEPVQFAAQRMFGSKDGALVLDALEKVFVGGGMAPKDKEGRVDPYAAMVNLGAFSVIEYLRALAKPKEGQEP